MPDEPTPRNEDRRTRARLHCVWGKGCMWYVETSDASMLAEAWERHSRDHWNTR